MRVVSAAPCPGGPCEDALQPAGASFIELCLRGGRRLIVRRGFDRQLLAQLVQMMEGEPSTLEGEPSGMESLT